MGVCHTPPSQLVVRTAVILLTLSLSVTIDTPTNGRGGMQQNGSLAELCPTPAGQLVVRTAVAQHPLAAAAHRVPEPGGSVRCY